MVQRYIHTRLDPTIIYLRLYQVNWDRLIRFASGSQSTWMKIIDAHCIYIGSDVDVAWWPVSCLSISWVSGVSLWCLWDGFSPVPQSRRVGETFTTWWNVSLFFASLEWTTLSRTGSISCLTNQDQAGLIKLKLTLIQANRSWLVLLERPDSA